MRMSQAYKRVTNGGAINRVSVPILPVTFLGAPGIGKSTLVKRFCYGSLPARPLEPTVGTETDIVTVPGAFWSDVPVTAYREDTVQLRITTGSGRMPHVLQDALSHPGIIVLCYDQENPLPTLTLLQEHLKMMLRPDMSRCKIFVLAGITRENEQMECQQETTDEKNEADGKNGKDIPERGRLLPPAPSRPPHAAMNKTYDTDDVQAAVQQLVTAVRAVQMAMQIPRQVPRRDHGTGGAHFPVLSRPDAVSPPTPPTPSPSSRAHRGSSASMGIDAEEGLQHAAKVLRMGPRCTVPHIRSVSVQTGHGIDGVFRRGVQTFLDEFTSVHLGRCLTQEAGRMAAGAFQTIALQAQMFEEGPPGEGRVTMRTVGHYAQAVWKQCVIL